MDTDCWFQSCINQTTLQSNTRKLWLQMGHPIAATTRHEYVIRCSFIGPWSYKVLVIFETFNSTMWVQHQKDQYGFSENGGVMQILCNHLCYCGWSFASTLLVVILLAIASIEITSWMLSGASWTFCAWSLAKVSWSFPDSFQTNICCYLFCHLMLPPKKLNK